MIAHRDHIYSHLKHSCQSLDIFICWFQPASSSPFLFSGWIKNISPDVMTEKTAYFWNHEGSYYDVIRYVWKNTTVIKIG